MTQDPRNGDPVPEDETTAEPETPDQVADSDDAPETAPAAEDETAAEPEDEDETAGEPEDEDEPSRSRVSPRSLVTALVVVLFLAALSIITISTISLWGNGGSKDAQAQITCGVVDRIDIGGPEDDFSLTIEDTTSNSLSSDGSTGAIDSGPGKASYVGVDPDSGEKISGDLEYTAGQVTWAASSIDTSYIQISECSNEKGDVVVERKLQVFVVKDATATSEKTISITSEG